MFSRRFALFAVVIVAVAALAVACGGGGGASGGGSAGGAQNVTITATDFKFDPNTINATPGQTINLTMVNKGQSRHTFVLKDANVSIAAEAGQQTQTTFKAPSNPGTYQFLCDVPGHAEQGMTGQLIVK